MTDSVSSALKAPFSSHRPNGGWTSMPWWVQAITVVGVPGVLVMYMVYTNSQELPATRRAAEQALSETIRNRELIREHMAQAEANQRLLQRICSNTAKTYEERNRCFD